MKNKLKKKIAILMGAHWNKIQGGAQYQVKCLVDEMIKKDLFEIFYLAKHIDSDYSTGDYKIVKIGKNENKILLLDTYDVIKKLKEIKPDAIYQRGLKYYSLLTAFYGRHYNCKTIFHIAHDYDVIPIKYNHLDKISYLNFEKKIGQFGLKKFDTIIAQTEHQQRLLHRNYKIDTKKIIPNFHPSPIDLESKKDEKIKIIWIANFKPIKRPEIFVRLASELGHYNAEFTMIGRPGKNKQYIELMEKIKHIKNIRYLGEMEIDQVNNILSKGHIYVHTSEAEGFPNTFIQAWMRHVAIITLNYDNDGLFSKKEVGLLGNNYEGLKKGVELLVHNSELRAKIAENGYKYAINKHSLRNAEQIIEIFSND